MQRKYLTEQQIVEALYLSNIQDYKVYVDLYLKHTDDGPEGFYNACIVACDTCYISMMVRDNLMVKKYNTRDAILNTFGRDGGYTAVFRCFDYDEFLDHKPCYEMTDSEKKRWDASS